MTTISNQRPSPDRLLNDLAEYIFSFEKPGEEALQTARLCLMDALGCATAALEIPACARLLGPIVPGTKVPNGARVPATFFELDPITAAFDFGTMIRWLDYNDTFLAAEWGHPSDNLGAILPAADWVSRQASAQNKKALRIRDVLLAIIQAYEIQGVLSIGNSFHLIGLDHVLLVKVASAATTAHLLGANRDQVINAISNAWIDGAPLRTYRQAPNTGSRKSWAGGDAAARGLFLAWLAVNGEMGYPSALTALNWGFQDVLFKRQEVRLVQPLSTYIIENILFKVSYPAEFHAQTAVEAAIQLHPSVKNRLDEIEKVIITTQEAAMKIIVKNGPLNNPADRDHCIQYMTAVALINGNITSRDYEDAEAANPKIEGLRSKIVCEENPQYTNDYFNPEKRSIANALQVFFSDGSSTPCVEIAFPLGHRRRRADALGSLEQKFITNLSHRATDEQIDRLVNLFHDPDRLDDTPVEQFVDLWVSLDGMTLASGI
jgi:2-methylcitrate dehydratase